MLNKVTTSEFQKEVLEANTAVLVDFYADWCGPCKMQAPILDQAAGELPDVKVVKVNVDEEPALAQQFQIMSIPTLVAIKNGAVLQTALGVQSKQKIVSMFQ